MHIQRMQQRTRLIAARKAKLLTQEQVAEAIDVDQSTISRIENGDVEPSASIASRLIALLGISLSDLVDIEQRAKASGE